MGTWSGCWREAVRTKGVPGAVRCSALGRYPGAGLWADTQGQGSGQTPRGRALGRHPGAGLWAGTQGQGSGQKGHPIQIKPGSREP